jgi:hypothetical protein
MHYIIVVKLVTQSGKIVVHYERLKPGLIQPEGIVALDADDESDALGEFNDDRAKTNLANQLNDTEGPRGGNAQPADSPNAQREKTLTLTNVALARPRA